MPQFQTVLFHYAFIHDLLILLVLIEKSLHSALCALPSRRISFLSSGGSLRVSHKTNRGCQERLRLKNFQETSYSNCITVFYFYFRCRCTRREGHTLVNVAIKCEGMKEFHLTNASIPGVISKIVEKTTAKKLENDCRFYLKYSIASSRRP